MKAPVALCILLISFSATVLADTARIAVASNFAATARALANLFSQTSEHSVQLSSGSTGKLYIQIRHGAPFDLLLAADMQRPQRLFTEGFADSEPFIYATGQLLLWSRDVADVSIGLDALNIATIKRLAIANPKTAPYGKAAQQVLDGLPFQYAGIRLTGDNIAQTYQFAASGNANAAFVAAAQIALDQRGYAWKVPPSLYSPIHQGALLLTHGKENQAAHAFYRFLRSDQARSVIQNYGYTTE